MSTWLTFCVTASIAKHAVKQAHIQPNSQDQSEGMGEKMKNEKGRQIKKSSHLLTSSGRRRAILKLRVNFRAVVEEDSMAKWSGCLGEFVFSSHFACLEPPFQVHLLHKTWLRLRCVMRKSHNLTTNRSCPHLSQLSMAKWVTLTTNTHSTRRESSCFHY